MSDTHPNDLTLFAVDPQVLLDTLPDGLVVVDTQGVIRYLNLAWHYPGIHTLQIGCDFLTCYRATFNLSATTIEVLRTGLTSVLSGERAQFALDHTWQVAHQQGSVGLIIQPYHSGDTHGVLIRQVNTSSHRQVEASAQEQSYFLHTLLDAIPNPIFYKDRQGVYTGCNTAFAEFIGKPRTEIVGKTVYDIAPPDLAAIYHAADLALMEQQGTQRYESVVVYADGTRHDVIFIKATIIDSQGAVMGIVGTVMDITEQKRAAAALHQRDAILEAMSFAGRQFLETNDWEQKIQEVLARLGQATGADRAYIFANEGLRNGQMYVTHLYEWVAEGINPQINNPDLQNVSLRESGLARWEELLPQDIPIYGAIADFPPAEHDLLMSQDIRSLAVVPIFAGTTWWGFMGFDDCDQERDWSQLEIETLKIAAGIIGTAILRQQNEEAVRRTEVQYRELFDNASDIIYTHTLQGILTSVNNAMVRLTGYRHEELIGKNIAHLIAPEYLERTQMMTKHKLAEGGTTPYEVEFITCTGQRVLLETSTRLIYDHGQPVGVQGIARDITERRRAEEIARQSAIQAEIIRAQEAALAELSSPLLVIDHQIILMPLIGGIDARRSQHVIEELLHGVQHHRALMVIVDITGLAVVDTQVANAIIEATQAVRLLGAQVILTGISPQIAQTLVGLGVDLKGIITLSNLQYGVRYALKHTRR